MQDIVLDYDKLLEAYELAKTVHEDQVDKAGAPYIEHVKRVAQRCKYNKYEYITALLHDVVEDGDIKISYIYSHFGYVIGGAVELLTRQKTQGYEDYIFDISKNPIAMSVKLADLQDNMDITRLNQLTERDFERLKKYHKAYKTLKSYAK